MGERIILDSFQFAKRLVTDHAPTIASVCFTAGNLALAAKAGIHPDFDTAAGLFFIGHSVCLGFAKRSPTAAFRLAGAAGLLGAACMSANGIDFHAGQIRDAWRVASPMIGFGVTAMLLGLQKEIARAAATASASKNFIVRAFARTQKYPVVSAAAVDSTGIAGIAVSAMRQTDISMLGIVAVWAAGEVGLVLSDPRLQARMQKRTAQEPSPV